METLIGTPEYDILYGWYYRPSLNSYEFWWGNRLLVCVDAVMLDVMPDALATEIRASAMVKPELTATAPGGTLGS